MSKRRVFCIAKFGKRHHLEGMLRKGTLHMKRLRAFQKIEHAEIGDENEGLSHSWIPGKVEVYVDDVKLDNIVGPIRIVDDNSYNPHIFCMYAITDEHLDKLPGQYIDERCFEFGDSILVISNAGEFVQRVKNKLKELQGTITMSPVEYVSYETYHGEMGPLRKYDSYSHQSEYRIVYESGSQEETLNFEIGSLEDIAKIYKSADVNNLINIDNKA